MLLRTCLRQHDYAARYGGEEFALILRGADTTRAGCVLHRLRRHWAVLQPQITFSAGIATCRPDRRPEHTLVAADQALYQAKAAGRNQDTAEEPTPAAQHAARPTKTDPTDSWPF